MLTLSLECSAIVGLFFFGFGRIYFAIVELPFVWMEDGLIVGLVHWLGVVPRCFQTTIREASAAIERLVSPFGDNIVVYRYAALGFTTPVADAVCLSPFFI